MKYAILADVHANREALQAVSAEGKKAKPDRVSHLGDIVGYGASPVECVDAVRQWKAKGICGNHERYITGVTSIELVSRDDKRKTIEYSRDLLRPDQLLDLKSLPLQLATDDGLLFVHGSPRNDSDLGRPLLLYTLTSADAFPYTVNPIKPKHDQAILRGKRAAFAHHDPRPCLIPPDWSGGYTSIFSLQQKEDAAIAKGAGAMM